mmetsp:Transcript_16810/g.40533  ORF Transcript_16810/g.40533 Transcript_16810/m.40533 type:complete len:251 (+) Transcript_16810:262-1014(+)
MLHEVILDLAASVNVSLVFNWPGVLRRGRRGIGDVEIILLLCRGLVLLEFLLRLGPRPAQSGPLQPAILESRITLARLGGRLSSFASLILLRLLLRRLLAPPLDLLQALQVSLGLIRLPPSMLLLPSSLSQGSITFLPLLARELRPVASAGAFANRGHIIVLTILSADDSSHTSLLPGLLELGPHLLLLLFLLLLLVRVLPPLDGCLPSNHLFIATPDLIEASNALLASSSLPASASHGKRRTKCGAGAG